MKRPPPPTLRRIVLEFLALVTLHFVLLHLLARARLLEHLLAPGPSSRLALAATAFFLLLRLFLLVFGTGWLLARLWLWFSRPPGAAVRHTS
jgi:hypothetical protein